jgi:glycine cleavage system aminomethyltransferase T
MTIPIAISPMHHWHLAHGARMVEENGWQVPACYSNTADEFECSKHAPALADVSYVTQWHIAGKAAQTWLQRSYPDAGPGQVFSIREPIPGWICVPNNRLAILLSARILPDTHGENISPGLDVPEACTSNETSGYAVIGLSGPRHDHILRHQASLDLSFSTFPPGSCTTAPVAGVRALVIRLPVEPATLIFVARDVGEHVWERLWLSGQTDGLILLGMDAWRRLATKDRSVWFL